MLLVISFSCYLLDGIWVEKCNSSLNVIIADCSLLKLFLFLCNHSWNVNQKLWICEARFLFLCIHIHSSQIAHHLLKHNLMHFLHTSTHASKFMLQTKEEGRWSRENSKLALLRYQRSFSPPKWKNLLRFSLLEIIFCFSFKYMHVLTWVRKAICVEKYREITENTLM